MPRDTRLQQPDALPSYVDRIREHVERDEVRAARRVVAEALKEGSTEPGLAYWAEILAPAKVLGFKPADGTDLRDDIRWFDEHGRDYRGQWVAVLNGALLAHAEIYEDLRARLDEIAPEAYPLVHFVKQEPIRNSTTDQDPATAEEAEMTTYSTKLATEAHLWYPKTATERATEMPHAARIPQTDAPPSYVDRIREHVERDEVGAARRVLAEALQAGSTEPRLANWEKLLAPGRVIGSVPVRGSDRRAELDWLAAHGREYRGQWVAILEDQMLAHAQTYAELRAELDRLKSASPPLVHFIE